MCPPTSFYKDREKIDDVIDPVGIWITGFLQNVIHTTIPVDKYENFWLQ
jgi:hypothetical protein